MNSHLPVKAKAIHLAWRYPDGGIGVAAYTDAAAHPYIGLYPLDALGRALGLPLYLARYHFMARVVVSMTSSHPLIAFIDAAVSADGLDLRLALPRTVPAPHTPLHQSVRWQASQS